MPMESIVNRQIISEVIREIPDDNSIMHRLLLEPTTNQAQVAKDHFQELLVYASQPRHASGNACVKLCYFIEQCRTSDSKILRDFAFSEATCLDLASFYIEWNEKNQHRSLRQVLDLIATLITINPEKHISKSVKFWILRRTVSIITHHSALPLVKPALRALEYFLHKDVASLTDLIDIYGEISPPSGSVGKLAKNIKTFEAVQLDSCVSAVFEWMSLSDTSPAAGKFLVTLFRVLLRKSSSRIVSDDPNTHITLWHYWIRRGLSSHPESIDNIKNHIFSPLFKVDRSISAKFLYYLTEQITLGVLESQDLDAQALLLLSAIEVGKKIGLVDESGMEYEVLQGCAANSVDASLPENGSRTCVVLPEGIIASLLGHPSSPVRASSFSVLISSTSSTKPFSSNTFALLRTHLSVLHADPDARFRNEVLSNIKHMIERLKGAMSHLSRELNILITPGGKGKHIGVLKPQPYMVNNPTLLTENRAQKVEPKLREELLLEHQILFLQWYLDFLLNELIPTASYQRHITALKALQIVVKSGILEVSLPGDSTWDHSQFVWPRTATFFTEKAMRLLIDLIVDPFEDVRTSVISVLKFAPPASFNRPNSLCYAEGTSLCISSLQGTSPVTHASDTYRDGQVQYLKKEDFKGAETPHLLLDFIKRAEDRSLRTGRADLADGVAHSYELLYTLLATDRARLSLVQSLLGSLESKIAIAEVDLAQAVLLAPVHGSFASLRFVLDVMDQSPETSWIYSPFDAQLRPLEETVAEAKGSWEYVQRTIVQSCERIWIIVKGILCNDSPEGHLPWDLEELEVIDTKDVLSYSFRAIHESSNLLCMMINKIKSSTQNGFPLFPFELFCAAGNLSFEQLSNLRHRGAFSTVSMTFTKCCQLIQEGTSYGHLGAHLLDQWYQGTLTCINQQTSVTRRSAGIPALMSGILAAKSPQAFDQVIFELRNLARNIEFPQGMDEANLPQVHAINCLKEIFKSSILRKRCESHVTDCIQLAADCLKSEVWAIRNCGLLLLRSLIDSLFGTSESRVVADIGWDGRSVRLSYERYPALPELLLQLLVPDPSQEISTNFHSIGTVESVFPALDIIRRAGPPERLRSEIYNCISNHLGSKIWHIRDIAARTICTLMHDDWLPLILNLIESGGNLTNRYHGVLMSIKYLLERRLELDTVTEPEDVLVLSTKLHEYYDCWRICSICEAAYEDIITIVLKFLHLFVDNSSTSSSSEIPMLKRLLLSTDIIKKACTAIRRDSFLSTGGLLESINDSMGLALLRKSLALRALYAISIEGEISELELLVEAAALYDADTAHALLDHLPLVWNIYFETAEVLVSILELYIVAYTSTTSSEIRSAALQNLLDVLEQLLKTRGLSAIESNNKFQRLYSLIIEKGNPDLLSAEIRITGSLLAFDIILARRSNWLGKAARRIEEWGYMLLAVGRADNEFDARYASVLALRCFYHPSCISLAELRNQSLFVPSLLALYDTLSDDDEDIRAAGSEVVSCMFGTRLVPLAAASKLLGWLKQNFSDTEAFHIAALQRITENEYTTALRRLNGELGSVEEQLKVAISNDDSLFVEEEQNLYRDEVYEAIAWSSIILTSKYPTATRLSSWALEGIRALTRLTENFDGPLGQASTRLVFSTCMRVILAAKAVLSCVTEESRNASGVSPTSGNDEKEASQLALPEQKELCRAIDRLITLGTRNNLHPVLLDTLLK